MFEGVDRWTVLIYVLIFTGFGGRGKEKAYKVPNLLGSTVEEANEREDVKGIFTIDVVGPLNDDNFHTGQNVQQDTADRE